MQPAALPVAALLEAHQGMELESDRAGEHWD